VLSLPGFAAELSRAEEVASLVEKQVAYGMAAVAPAGEIMQHGETAGDIDLEYHALIPSAAGCRGPVKVARGVADQGGRGTASIGRVRAREAMQDRFGVSSLGTRRSGERGQHGRWRWFLHVLVPLRIRRMSLQNCARARPRLP
jgi:hypothetical protein